MPTEEEAQSVGPAKTFPSAERPSAPAPPGIETQRPARFGFAPVAA